MSAGQSIRKGTKWLIAGGTVGQILQFAFGIALARLLLPEVFGLVITIQVFTGIAGMIAGGGMGQALVQSKEANEKDFQVVFTMQLLLGVLIYTFFFILAPWFVTWFGNPIYSDLLRISALNFILRPFINIHNSWLQREMRFKERTILGFKTTLFGSILSVVMALTGFGVWSLVFSGLLGAVLSAFLISRLTPIRPRLIFDSAIVKQHGGYGIKVSANDIVSYVRKQVSNLIISRLAGAGTVGLFNKAASLGKMPFSMVSTAVYQPVFREMSKAQDDLDLSKYLFYKMISLLIIYTLPFYIGLAFLAELFIKVVYGENWIAAAEPLQILSLAGVLYCVGHPCGAVLAAQNRLGRELIVHATTMILVIVATFIGLKWGITGVAWGIVSCEIYSAIFMFGFAAQSIKTGISDLVRHLTPALTLNIILIASLAATRSVFSSESIETQPVIFLFVSILVGGVSYAAAFLFLPIKSLSSESLRWRKAFKIS